MPAGIEALQIYFPKKYVDQQQYQYFKKVPTGKYTQGLGQIHLSFVDNSEDVTSMAKTVVNNLMKNNNIHYTQVGRLEAGTQSLHDKSKSIKTDLMDLFKDNHDIQGATSINACYGGTNALINTLNWISSSAWDGRYGIIVATDIAVYPDGPARATGGAGAVAILIGPNGKIIFQTKRASFMDHEYDFYKPNPHSEYPVVDGKKSIGCYLNAIEQCYKKLKQKHGNKKFLQKYHYFCFHSPFYKMVLKAYTKLIKLEENLTEEQIAHSFSQKVDPTLFISQRIGNIYTGSLWANLISLLLKVERIQNKNVLLFSYGSGLCSTILTAKIKVNPLSASQISRINNQLDSRIKISPEKFTQIMKEREENYGHFRGKIPVQSEYLDSDTFYLAEIDQMGRRVYFINNPTTTNLQKKSISGMIRLDNIDKQLSDKNSTSFHKLSINQRINQVEKKSQNTYLNRQLLENGGLNASLAERMTQNVIGLLHLPLSVVPKMLINQKQYMVPFCTEQPSVVAACSASAKLIAPYSFKASSRGNLMMGQVYLPQCDSHTVNIIQKILQSKQIIHHLNASCSTMVQRGGGVVDANLRQLSKDNKYCLDIYMNTCEAMGANIINEISEKAKKFISQRGIKTGIAILSNYCTKRMVTSEFQIPISSLQWKGHTGEQVAQKILEAQQFATLDKYRACTNNKGIMNGIDSVCVATGQDWRAIESAAHVYASRSGHYKPLTKYEIIQIKGQKYFKGTIELPIAVGTVGGALKKNPLYEETMKILGNPSSQQLSWIMASVGLAQNLAALKALAIEGINKGHMALHLRATLNPEGDKNYEILSRQRLPQINPNNPKPRL